MSGPFRRRSTDATARTTTEPVTSTPTGDRAGVARRAVAAAHAAIAADGQPGVWIELLDRIDVERAADDVDRRLDAGERLALAGLTVAVKANIDVRGLRTTAGCRSFGRVAEQHAPAVQQLVDAGAVIIGVTNLDQFATGLVGTRSPYGICPNAHWDGLISGGSSSGSAVAVARGHVDIAVGTDTAGSGRVPAAANGIVGWKPTRWRVSTAGVVPACASFDCVSFFGRDVAVLDRVRAVVATPRTDEHQDARGAPVRLGVAPAGSLTFDGDASWGAAVTAAIERLVAVLGATEVQVDLDPFVATGRLLYESALVRERYDAVGAFVEAHRDDVDPIVHSIIHAAGARSPADLDRDRAVVAARARALGRHWDDVDVMVVPTVPRVPTVAEVQAEPVAVNAMLGTYTNFVNLLGLCAVTIPASEPRTGPPASVTLLAPAGRDELLLALASAATAGGRDGIEDPDDIESAGDVGPWGWTIS